MKDDALAMDARRALERREEKNGACHQGQKKGFYLYCSILAQKPFLQISLNGAGLSRKKPTYFSLPNTPALLAALYLFVAPFLDICPLQGQN